MNPAHSPRSAHTPGCLTALLRIWLALALLVGQGLATAQICAAPGRDGALTVAAANTVINSHYPAPAGSLAAGATNLTLGTLRPGGGPALAAGDLILIMQMQDGSALTVTNNSAYGGGSSTAGRYEFARVAQVVGSAVTLTAALSNTYVQNTAATNNQTYQVIRVPQYSVLTINAGASIVPQPWDGTSGGVVVADVSGVFTNNGLVDVSFAGFRGSAGASLGGVAGATTPAPYEWVRPDTYAAHGGKGEGFAGTPDRVVQVFSTPGVLAATVVGTSTNITTPTTAAFLAASTLITTGRSYNGGSRGGGALGNGGGGGVDSAPVDNSENSGGGGGGSWGSGGKGGNNWNQPTRLLGGMGGSGVTGSAAPTWTPTVTLFPAVTLGVGIPGGRLIMGGGGGSGSSNNAYGIQGSGGAGGGIALFKAQSIAGTGQFRANGQAGRSIPAGDGTNGTTVGQCPVNSTGSCDGAGAGGGGGGIVLLGPTGGSITAQANGGQGGNINGTDHGPGGGGGGGYVITTTGITAVSALAGGLVGRTNLGGTPANYGGFNGENGGSLVQDPASLSTLAGGLPQNCLPAVTANKITAVPASIASIVPPGTTTYSIVFSNQAGRGDARGLTLFDPALPSTMNVRNPPVGTVSFNAAPTACTLSTRTAVVNPPNAATTGLTAGTFSLPGGCTATYTFTINVPTTVPDGTYSNSVVAWFTDPTNATARTVTNAAFTGGLVGANTSFNLGGTVGGSNYDGTQAGNTREDIRVQRLQIWKAVTVTGDVAPIGTVSPGDTITWSVFVRNPGVTSVAVQVTDTLPVGLNFGTGGQSVAVTSGGCTAPSINPAFNGAGVNTLLAAAQSIGATCTIRINIPTVITVTSALTAVTNTAQVAGTTTIGTSPQVSSSNLDSPSGVASAIPGLGAGNFPSGIGISQTATIQVTPTLAIITPAVNLAVTKTNNITTLQAGQTTSYTITVSNLGPSTATNALLTDPARTGLSCTTVACSGFAGAATCPPAGSVTIANLQGSGIPITVPRFSSVSFSLRCNVTASGRP